MGQSTLVAGRACEHCKLEVTTCKGCGAEILFARTSSGNANIPLDAKITQIFARVGGVSVTSVNGHVSHFVTCPEREKF